MEIQLIYLEAILIVCVAIVVMLFKIIFAAITSFGLAVYKIQLLKKSETHKKRTPYRSSGTKKGFKKKKA